MEPSGDASAVLSVRPRLGGRLGAVASGALVLACLLAAGVTLVGRYWSAPTAAVAALVTFLPYLYAALAASAFAAWTLFPDRRGPPAVMGVALAVAAALWGPTWGRGATVDEGDQVVRVMSWNLRRFWGGPADGGSPGACVAAAIDALDPDVLTLLEVSAADVKLLEAAAGMRCVHHPYRASTSDRVGGLAACTRRAWTVTGGGQRFVDGEDWYYVRSEVTSGESVFNLLAVHLTPYDYAARRLTTGVKELTRGQADTLTELGRDGEVVFRGQADQTAALLERVRRFRDPTVVAGDFNSTRDTSLHRQLRQHLADTWERGGVGFGGTIDVADWLPLRIDYVYASPDFDVVSSTVPALGCSDHRPVVSELTLR
jgi:endonuclease/exonuclease/phosphatase (EEP) superfamily protein YafD